MALLPIAATLATVFGVHATGVALINEVAVTNEAPPLTGLRLDRHNLAKNVIKALAAAQSSSDVVPKTTAVWERAVAAKKEIMKYIIAHMTANYHLAQEKTTFAKEELEEAKRESNQVAHLQAGALHQKKDVSYEDLEKEFRKSVFADDKGCQEKAGDEWPANCGVGDLMKYADEWVMHVYEQMEMMEKAAFILKTQAEKAVASASTAIVAAGTDAAKTLHVQTVRAQRAKQVEVLSEEHLKAASSFFPHLTKTVPHPDFQHPLPHDYKHTFTTESSTDSSSSTATTYTTYSSSSYSSSEMPASSSMKRDAKKNQPPKKK
jgi:hypothetical protein